MAARRSPAALSHRIGLPLPRRLDYDTAASTFHPRKLGILRLITAEASQPTPSQRHPRHHGRSAQPHDHSPPDGAAKHRLARRPATRRSIRGPAGFLRLFSQLSGTSADPLEIRSRATSNAVSSSPFSTAVATTKASARTPGGTSLICNAITLSSVANGWRDRGTLRSCNTPPRLGRG
jgi:hypothetical protein